MPVVLDAFLVQLLFDGIPRQVSFLDIFFFGTLCCPLERGKGLRNKKRCTCHNLYLAIDALILRNRLKKDGCNLIGQFGNPPDIFLCFCGKPQHKVKLYPCPAAFKGKCRALQNILFRQTFVNDISKALAASFRRKGKACLFDILHLTHHV